MMLDLGQFPLVRILPINTTQIAPERQIELLLDREQPFVLMMHRRDERHPDDNPENRKSRSRFFKQNRDRLKRLCAAAILVEGDSPVSPPIKAMAWGLSKAFGVPFHFAHDEDLAVSLARRYVVVQTTDHSISRDALAASLVPPRHAD
ncbi:hypothetical protein [Ottowia testudinis]|uniref:Uncharacterized protein n=1 Tax=Ottowia testudinis TaxID=2816950 RepID=A0A975CDZ4_9BURK|nr:hypothetical protein [Ottowia testudinis]QTD44097.1 hypothetical protein J1M35_13260 [Ottowia testudinis]